MFNHSLSRLRTSAFPLVAGVLSEAAPRGRTRAFAGTLFGAACFAALCIASPAMAEKTTSTGGCGIHGRSIAYSVTISNTGSISTSLTGYSAIDAFAAGSLNITNSGTIATTGRDADGIRAEAGPSFPGPFLVSITGGSVVASGTNSSGINARGGVYGEPPSPVANMRVTIADGASVTGGGGGMGAGVRFVGGANNVLTNYGTISSSSGLAGLAVLGDANTGYGPPGCWPIGNNTVNNYGTIRGSVDLGSGSNAFNNHAGATFNAGSVIRLNGGTLTNAGTLALGTPGSIQTTALYGNYTQTSSGSLAIALNAVTGRSSQLAVTGNVSLAGSIAVNPNFLPLGVAAVNPTSLPQGVAAEDFKILSATGTISIASNIVLPANTATTGWSLIYLDPHDVALEEKNLNIPQVNSNTISHLINLDRRVGAVEQSSQNSPQLITNVPPPITAPAEAPMAPTWIAAGNTSNISQTGSNNSIGAAGAVGVEQAVDDTGSSGNLSVINQGVSGGNASYNASATLTQHTSSGGLASSLINQDSGGASTANGTAGNTASVTQNIGLGDTASTSTVNQSGAALYASVTQGSIDSANIAVNGVSSYVEQIGSGATASVSQTASGASSVIIQHGNGAYGGSGAAGTWNASVSQSAGSNTSGISQTSAVLGTVGVTQNGAGSADSQVWQSATAVANIGQAGTGNNASYVTQTFDAGGASASINQLGSSDNQSLVNQSAGGISNVYQTGLGNFNLNQSAIGQSGTGTVIIYQGYASAGVAALSGASSNFSGVTQTGAGTVTVVQSGAEALTNLSLISQDYASTADVSQTASNGSNTSSIIQTGGSGNTAAVKQR
jgi:hypothetical protein